MTSVCMGTWGRDHPGNKGRVGAQVRNSLHRGVLAAPHLPELQECLGSASGQGGIAGVLGSDPWGSLPFRMFPNSAKGSLHNTLLSEICLTQLEGAIVLVPPLSSCPEHIGNTGLLISAINKHHSCLCERKSE